MKIFYVVSKITDSGGVSSVLSTRLNYLADVLGFEVFIFSTNDETNSPFFKFSDKISFHFCKIKMKYPSHLMSFKNELKQQINLFNPGVVCVADNGFKSLLIKNIVPKNIPCVYELHAEPNYFYGAEYKGLKNKLVKYFIDFFIPKFDEVVTLKNVSAKYLNPNKVTVIPNPITLNVDKTSNLNNNKIVAIGRLEEVKNFETLIYIWKEVVQKFPNYVLEIYGEGSKFKALNNIIKTENLYNHIKIFKPVKGIEKVLLQADVFVLPSKSESFSLVTLEAMACGLPVISFNIGMEHLIVNNKSGFIVDTNQMFVMKLCELLANFDLRTNFGKEAVKLSSNFTIENNTKQWLALFKKIKSL